jgi:hypothetical protein
MVMTEISGKVVVKWVNNRAGLVCLVLENGDTCVVHKTKLSVGAGCNTRNLKRGSELVISSKDDEWTIL